MNVYNVSIYPTKQIKLLNCHTIYLQVRNLRWLGFRVPLVLVNRAAQANQLHPHAVCLIESVRTYQATCEKVSVKLLITFAVNTQSHN